MKIGKLNSTPTQTSREGIIDNYFVVEDNYNFSANSSTDVTSYETLSTFSSNGAFNYRLFRDSLIDNILPNFNSLSNDDKISLINNRVYPANFTDSDIISFIGVDGLNLIRRNLSESELSEQDVKILHDSVTGYTATTSTIINSKLFTSDFNTYSGATANKIPIIYSYNSGSAPTVVTTPKIFNGKTTTNSSGVATFQLTTNGLSGGTAIFTNIFSIKTSAENNTTNVTDVPLSSIKTLSNSNKTLTLNVVNSAVVVLSGQGLEFVGSGITVDVVIYGN